MGGDPTFFQQLRAMTYRSFLLKRRNWSHTLREILFPLYFIAVIVIIMFAVQQKPHDPVPSFPLVDATHPSGWDKRVLAFAFQSIAVAPSSPETENFAEQVAQCMQNITSVPYRIVPYSSGQAIQDDYFKNNLTSIVGLVVNVDNVTGKILPNYELRFPGSRLPAGSFQGVRTSLPNGVLNLFRVCTTDLGTTTMPMDCMSPFYYYSGFVDLQLCVDSTLIMQHQPSFQTPHMKLQLMPRPSVRNVTGAQWFGSIAPVYILFSLCFMIMFLVVYIVDEKEKKLQELLRMVGVRTSAYWLGWFIPYMIIYAIVSTMIIMIMRYVPNLMNYSNLFIVFILFILSGLCLLCYGLMLVPFFTKANVAAPAVMASAQITSLIFILFKNIDLPIWAHYIVSLGGNLSFIFALDQVFLYENDGIGLHWSNFAQPASGKLSCLNAVIMLCVDIVLYTLLALYFDNVVPGENGARAHPLYFLSMDYWRNTLRLAPPRTSGDMEGIINMSRDGSIGNASDPYNSILNDDPNVEPMPASAKIGAVTINLTKSFTSGWSFRPSKTTSSAGGAPAPTNAVDGLTVALYQNQITAILGHNGAGKTTLIALLNGLIRPTSGTAHLLGIDITRPGAIERVRAVTGVCTQHDSLWGALTVREHLTIFSMLKAVKNVKAEVDHVVDEVELRDKLDVQSKALSGGMKRRLCCALALVGSPRVMFLDEPTSGVDPYSRRKLWDVLKRRRQEAQGCMIVLTTHSMHEADVLADRKIMLSHGRLRCAGSSMFLKNRFGLGYHVHGTVYPPISNGFGSNISGIDEQLRQDLSNLVPEQQIEFKTANDAGGVAFELDVPKTTSVEKLADTLEWLEAQESRGVRDINVSMSTLEEVFLSLEHESIEESARNAERLGSTRSPSPLLVDNLLQAGHASPLPGSKRPLYDNGGVRRATTLDKLWALVFIRIIVMIRQPWKMLWRIGFSCAFIIGSGYLRSRLAAGSGNVNNGVDLPVLSISDLVDTVLTQADSDVGKQHPFILKNDSPTNMPTDAVMNYFKAQKWSNALYTGTYAQLQNYSSSQSIYVGSDISNLALTGGQSEYTMWVNDTFSYGMPVAVNILSSALYGLATNNSNDRIRVNAIALVSATQESMNQMANLWTPILFAFAIVSVSAYFTADIVLDKEIGARAVLKMSGASFWLYWMSAGIYHIVSYYFPPVIACIISALLFGWSFGSTSTIALFILIMIIHIFVMTLFAYVCSFLYAKQERALSWQPILIVLTSFVPGMILPFLDIASQSLCTTLTTVACAIFPGVPLFIILISFLMKQVLGVVPGIDLSYLDTRRDVAFACNAAHLLLLTFILVLLEAYVSNVVSLPAWLRTCFGRKRGGRPISAVINSSYAAAAAYDAADDADQRNNHNNYVVDDDVVREAQLTAEAVGAQQVQYGMSNGSHYINTSSNNNNSVLNVLRLRKEYRPWCSSCRRSGKALACCRKQQDAAGNNSDGTFVAVRNASFRVIPNEVFGLLGPNGAGKTTTISVIVGEARPTRGDVYVGPYAISENAQRARSHLGYCPQRDALWDLLTVADHINLYSTLRGAKIVDPSRARLYGSARTLGLEEHIRKPAKALSGGTKRKLSFLIGITAGSGGSNDGSHNHHSVSSLLNGGRGGGMPVLGNVCLLDEPSTGMDPASKRFFWNIIRKTFNVTPDLTSTTTNTAPHQLGISNGVVGLPISQISSSAILTTHSMEEAETLCDRLAIMVRGRIRCIGSAAHLKAKYAAGYVLEIKLNNNNNNNNSGNGGSNILDTETAGRERVKYAIENQIFRGNARLNSDESVFDRLVYEIENPGRLSRAFLALNALRADGGGDVAEYVLMQNSLEQVFLRFAKEQEEEVTNL